ncbi:MAG: hypothetical protein ACI9HK_001104 [Pirellulaceae bacterium]|jgi:hypothetical protein
MFEVTKQPQDARRNHVLRLTPAGIDPKQGTYLLAAFDKKSGLIRSMEFYLHKERIAEFKVKLNANNNSPHVRKVVLTSAAGQTIQTWSLKQHLKIDDLAHVSTNSRGLAELDLYGEKAALNPMLRSAFARLRGDDQLAAMKLLNELHANHPDQPLYAFLLAYLQQSNPQAATRDSALLLKTVAKSRALDLTRAITAENFPLVPPTTLLEIGELQPVETRTYGDWYRLAGLAQAAGNFGNSSKEHDPKYRDDALRKAMDFVTRAKGEHAFITDVTIRNIELLIQRRNYTAAQRLSNELSQQKCPVEKLIRTATLWSEIGETTFADTLLLNAPDQGESAQQQFLSARAGFHSGRERWSLLVQLAASLPSDSSRRQLQIQRITAEMNRPVHAAIAAELAASTGDLEIKNTLRLRQAELLTDPQAKAELCWQLLKQGAVPSKQFAWACEQLNAGMQPERAIEQLEKELHQRRLNREELRQLAKAYIEVERQFDYHRTQQQDTEPNRPELNRPVPRRRRRNDPLPGGFF